MNLDDRDRESPWEMWRLQTCAARISTDKAGISLAGTRKARCDELAELLANAQNHADRLAFAVEADLQSELHAGNNAT